MVKLNCRRQVFAAGFWSQAAAHAACVGVTFSVSFVCQLNVWLSHAKQGCSCARQCSFHYTTRHLHLKA